MSNPMVTSEGGYVGVKLTLMLRFRRKPEGVAHVETFWRYGRRPNVGLCGIEFTDERILQAYPVGDPKASKFWEVVCQGCKQAMDKLS
jgi:hypothetical protein